MGDGPLGVAARVVGVLEDLRVPYVIGGSLASSVHGLPRSTNGVDLVADVRRQHVKALVETLGAEFYIDAQAAEEAVVRGSSFNLIHYDTGLKIDVFVCGADSSVACLDLFLASGFATAGN